MFETARQLTPTDDPQVFHATLDESWYQGRGAFGGLLNAWLLQAMEAQVDDDRVLRSLSVSFVAPLTAGQARVEAEVVRSGRYVTQLTGRVRGPDGTLATTALATFCAKRPKGPVLETIAADAPDVPPLDEVTWLPPIPGLPQFTQHVDFAFTDGRLPFTGGDLPRVTGWTRFKGSCTVDLPLVVALADIFPPAVVQVVEGLMPAATVDLSIHILDPEALAEAGPDSAWIQQKHGTFAADGYAEEVAGLWTASGRLVARMRQWQVVVMR